MSDKHQEKYDTLETAFGLSSELGDYLDRIELQGEQPSPELRQTLAAQAHKLNVILPMAQKYRLDMGGSDVLDEMFNTVERARRILRDQAI